jgi:hypothetical protein
MSTFRLATPLLVLSASGAPAAAQVVLDFESLMSPGTSYTNVGEFYEEDGFRFTKPPGEPYPFAVWQTGSFGFPGSTSLFNNTVDGLTILAQASGAPFDLVSMKLSVLGAQGTVRVAFTGHLVGGGQVFQEFEIIEPAPPPELHEVQFVGFENVTSVEWYQRSPFHQFDDVTLGSPCYADCDTTTGQGVLDIFDFLCFQNRFDAGASYACDCDTTTGVGVCDVFDFLCFQNEFASGCQ